MRLRIILHSIRCCFTWPPKQCTLSSPGYALADVNKTDVCTCVGAHHTFIAIHHPCHSSPHLYAAATPSRHFSRQSMPHLHFTPIWLSLCHYAHTFVIRPRLLQCYISCTASHWLRCSCPSFSLYSYINPMHNSLFKLHIFGTLCLHSFVSFLSFISLGVFSLEFCIMLYVAPAFCWGLNKLFSYFNWNVLYHLRGKDPSLQLG